MTYLTLTYFYTFCLFFFHRICRGCACMFTVLVCLFPATPPSLASVRIVLCMFPFPRLFFCVCLFYSESSCTPFVFFLSVYSVLGFNFERSNEYTSMGLIPMAISNITFMLPVDVRLVSAMCISSISFFRVLSFHPRAIGACPMATDLVMAMMS